MTASSKIDINLIEVPSGGLLASQRRPDGSFPSELDSQLSKLAEETRSTGISKDVVLGRKPDGRFQLLSGEARYFASLKNGDSSIPAVVDDAWSPVDPRSRKQEIADRLSDLEVDAARLRSSQEGKAIGVSGSTAFTRAVADNYVAAFRLKSELAAILYQENSPHNDVDLPTSSRQLREAFPQKGSMPPNVVALLYAMRDAEVAKLALEPEIHVDHLTNLDWHARWKVADELWQMCDAQTRDALLHDEHHHVRSCATISQQQETPADNVSFEMGSM